MPPEDWPKAGSQEEYNIIKDATQPGLRPPKEVTQIFPSVWEGEAGSDDAENSLCVGHIPAAVCHAAEAKERHKAPYLLWHKLEEDMSSAQRH